MNILVVALFLPMPDRQAGMLRFYHLLKLLAKQHHVLFFSAELEYQKVIYGEAEVNRYHDNLTSLGIEVNPFSKSTKNIFLRTQHLDVVFFEHYDTVRRRYIDLGDIRYWQPHAKMVIDTVDVEFNRLLARAEIIQDSGEYEKALETKASELAVYAAGDLIIAISEEDKKILVNSGCRTSIEVIPLLQKVPELQTRMRSLNASLLFVGNFQLDANVDAMIYFTREVLPLIRRRIPEIKLTIVGNSPPEDVQQLPSESVEVLGFVPDLAPLYATSTISVAPIRWGGGLKGKIVEAMSFGLPVATTTKGSEGFGLTPGHNVMLGDTPKEFAAAVIDLLRDRLLYERIRSNAWRFVKENFSEEVVADKINDIFGHLDRYGTKRLPIGRTVEKSIRTFLDQHVLWRFTRSRNARTIDN